MKFENTEVWGFEHAVRGMRNPMNSWDKSDSEFHFEDYPDAILGKEDLALMQKLIKAGSEHRKFMRQIFVSVDITAPLYWWKEFDTYKVGTVANSTSTMHKLSTTPITLDCFETDDYDSELLIVERALDSYEDAPWQYDNPSGNEYYFFEIIIGLLESLREAYIETKDKKYWKELIRWLPESWLQTRTITMNYENLLTMCSKGQRRFHKLNEWSGIDNSELPNFISWARTLPYAQELIFLDEINQS